jgi:uncharacterized protein YfdQ (DUF2303 family)
MTNTIDNLRTALDAGASAAPSHDTPDGGKIIVVPQGYRAEKVPPLEPKLPRIRQGVTLHDRDSFTAYVNRFKQGEATRLFAEPGFLASGAARVVAVIDYHLNSQADHGAHTATYSPRYSDQWQRWQKACAQPMKQAEFAEFIEEVRADIVEPDAAKLLDIVRTFKASKKVEFDSVVYQPNGDVKLVYDERTEQKGSSGLLPEQMKLGIPVYFRGSAYAVPVLVRYRVSNGAVAFSLKVDRADVIEDTAFSELTKAIGEATGIDCYLGRR